MLIDDMKLMAQIGQRRKKMVISVTVLWYALNFVKADTKARLRTSNFEFFFAPFFKSGHAPHSAHQLKARADSASLRSSAFC
ncbi:MAG: hypothetical protein CVV06_19725 [Gammaproteobacteria bacterium HGW-Gammaproteobacteria-10]|nr:MAG: hypothetical protein CVV06_19725 [Gammaproteobacteria bacterium HGW-Gammaproteobacteria-10]